VVRVLEECRKIDLDVICSEQANPVDGGVKLDSFFPGGQRSQSLGVYLLARYLLGP
jgi:hypothetical protein